MLERRCGKERKGLCEISGGGAAAAVWESPYDVESLSLVVFRRGIRRFFPLPPKVDGVS